MTKGKFKTDIVNRYLHNEGFKEMAESENCSVNDIWEYLKKQDIKKAFEKLKSRKGKDSHFWIDGRASDPNYRKKHYQKNKDIKSKIKRLKVKGLNSLQVAKKLKINIEQVNNFWTSI